MMARVRPKPNDFGYRTTAHVTVYLDDIANLAENLRPFGPVVIEVSHRGDTTSLVDDPLELIGRDDVWKITTKVEQNDSTRLIGKYVPISVDVHDALGGVQASYEQSRPELAAVVQHFAGSLQPTQRTLWDQLRRRPPRDVQLVMDTRRATWENARRRGHEIKLELLSGLVGAVIGALVTIGVAVLTR
jgi:hypothetical protein